MKKTSTSLKTALAVCVCIFAATASWAANGVWSGTVNALWTNSNNWSASPFPSGTDIATFSTAGNGQSIDIAGLSSITSIIYDSPSVAAYTNGTGAANSQTLVLADNGIITLTDTAENSQLFNCGLQLGTTIAGSTYTITNANTAQTLTFNNVFGPASGGTAGAKTLVLNGAGNTTILGSLTKGGATSITLTDNSSGTCTVNGTNIFPSINMNGPGALVLPGSNTVTTLNMNGSASSVVDIGDGFLALSNNGSTTLASTQGGTINGEGGKLWLSGVAGAYADNYVALGKTLTINTSIVSPGGFEFWGPTSPYGTFVLNAINTFDMDVLFNVAGTISVSKIGNKGSTTSNLGKGNIINFNANTAPGGAILYTGIGEESDRTLTLSQNNCIVDHSGSGLLKFTAPLMASGTAKTFILQGSTSGIGEIAGAIPNGANTALAKNGSGTWILSGANLYPGATTVNGGTLVLTGTNGAINASSGYTINAGGTLLLDNTLTANNTNRLRDASAITLSGGTLCMTNNGGTVNYRENAGALTIGPGGSSTIATTAALAGQSNILTFASLTYSGGKINFAGTDLGDSDCNRIFITGVTNGLMGAWATVNGTSYAAYSSTRGVYAFTTGFSEIAAQGGVDESVITNNGALLARISLPGISGPITLEGAQTNSIGHVLQNMTTNTTIAMINGVTNKLLRTAGLSIAEGKFSLTVGENENDGTLSALTAGGSLVLENNSADNALTVNAAIVNNTSASTLSKIGMGAVVLKGTNTYSGTTYISEGALTFGGSLTQTVTAAISGAGTLAKTGNGALNLNAASTYSGGTFIDGGSTVIAPVVGSLGTGIVTNNGTLNLTAATGNADYSYTFGNLSGSGTVNMSLPPAGGSKSTRINGTTNFTGTLNIGVNQVVGTGRLYPLAQYLLLSTPAVVNISSNSTLLMDKAVTNTAFLNLYGGTTGEPYGQLRIENGVNWAGPVTLFASTTFGGNGTPAEISGNIGENGGNFGITRLGTGTTILSGLNTYSGPTWVKAGAISVPSINSVNVGAGTLGFPVNAAQGAVRLGDAAAGTLIYTGTGNTSDRLIDLAGTTFGGTLDQSGTGLLKFTGGMMISVAGNKTLTLQGSTAGTGEFSGVISNGVSSTVSLTKLGTGTWTLSGANTFTGVTLVNGGTLDVSGSLGSGGVTYNTGTGAKVIARSATALGTGLISFATGTTTPSLEFKIDGGGTIALPNTFLGNSGITGTINVDNNGTGTGGVIQFNGLTNKYASATLNVTGANGYSLYFANIRDAAGSAGTMTLNPTTAALGIGELSGHFTAANSYIVVLDGTNPSNTIGVIRDKTDTANTTITITKTNSSTWTLTGVSTYTGATAVNGGTLLVNAPGSLGAASAVTVNKGGVLGGSGTINGIVTANAGGRLAPGGVGSIATFNLSSNLTLTGGTLAFDISNVATDKVAVAGSLIVNNVNIVDLSLLSGSLSEGTYTLMTYASKSGSGSFALDRGYPNATLTSDSTNLVLTVGSGGMSSGMTWKGTFNTNWDGADLNWDIDGVATNFSTGNLVTFDDTASAFTVAGIGTVNPGNVVFNNASDYTVTAAIDGAAPIVKLGAGTTTLTGLSTYNPADVVVSEGMLTLGGASTLNSGLYAGDIFNDSFLNYASSSTQTNSGAMTGVGTLIQSGSGTLALSGTVSGTGSLLQSGSGMLVLLSSNAFSGTVTVDAGILMAQNPYALGTTAVGTTVNAGGTLGLSDNISYPAEALNNYGVLSSQTGSNTYAGVVTLQAGSAIDVGLDSVLILTAKTPNNGPAPFSKTGPGTLRLTNDPDHRGVCTVAEGRLELMGTGSTDVDLIINAGATLMETTANLGNFRLTNNGTFELRVADDINGLDGSGLVTIGNTGSYKFTAGNGNQSGAFAGVIENGTGKMDFQKSGSGVQILSGVNTYTGTTTVAGGTLLINTPGSLATNSAVTVNNGCTLGGSGTINGPVNMVSGSTLLPGDANVIGTLTLGSSTTALTLNGATLRYDLSNVAGNCDLITLSGVSGDVLLTNVNVIVLSFPNGAAPVGTYTLMTFNTCTGTGSFRLASAYPNASLVLNANSLELQVTGGSTSSGLTWGGFYSGAWDSAIMNWIDGVTQTTYTPGQAVVFDDTAFGNFTVSSGAAVSPASMFFNNSAFAYTISANVAGTGSLVKLGSGGLTLSGLSTYNPSSITFYGTLTLSGASRLNNNNYSGPINNNGTLSYTSSQAQILGGVISGSGALIKDSASTMTLSGTNTYTGATTVRGGGTLKIMNNAALGTTANGTTVTNGILEVADNITTLAEGLTLYGTLSSLTGTNTYSGAVNTLGNASIFNVGTDSLLILSASNTGAGTFTKTGNGTLRFAKDPNNTGAMTINGGVVEITDGTTDGDVIINSGATFIAATASVNDNKSVTVNAGGVYDFRAADTIAALNGAGLTTKGIAGLSTLTVGNNNTSSSFSGVIQDGVGQIALTKTGTGTLTLSGINTFSGNLSIAGTLLLTGAGQFGSGLYAGTITNTGIFVHDSSANQILNGVISGTAGQLRKTGTGTLTLGAINTYTGATAISNGVLKVFTGGSCASSAVTLAAATGKSASLEVGVPDITKQWTCAILTVNNVGTSSGLTIDFGYNQPSTSLAPLKITGALTLTTTPVLTIKGGFLPVTTGNGYPLMTWGSGSAAAMTTVVLPGRVTGSVVVIGTTNYLQITSNNQPLLWASSGSGTWNTTIGNTVWKDLVGSITAYSEATLPGDQVVFSDSNLVATTTVTLSTTVTPARVTVTNEDFSYTISGSGGIAGGTGLTKSGSNTLTLATANTFTGLTAINDGTLKLGNAAALRAGNTLTMAGKGTLDMNGNATALTNISASVAANTITDSAGAGTTTLSILNQTTTIAAAIKDGATRTVAVNLANNNGGAAAFALNTSNTYSGGLTLKHTTGGGTRLIVGSPVITVGTPGNITSSPFGRGAITIGEAATDKAGIYMNANNATIVNDLIVNTTNGTDLIYALRVDGTGNNVSGKVTANSDLTFGSNGTGSTTLTNEISGAGGVRLVTSSTLLTVNLYGPNTYLGKTTLREGTLAFNSIGNVGSGPSALGAPTTVDAGTIKVGNGAKTGMTLLYRGMGHTTDRVLELAGTSGGLSIDHSGTNLLKFTSDLLMSGSGGKRLALTGANNSTGEVAGVISDNAGGKLNLYKDGVYSTWRISGANTFTDNVNINAGKLIITDSQALGLGIKTIYASINGTAGNPQLHLDGSVGPITLGTNIMFETSNTGGGSIHNIKGTNTLEGKITMTGGGGDTVIFSLADKLFMRGNMSANTSIRMLRLKGNGDGEISGIIDNGATTNLPVFREVGTGTWTLSGTNTYSGATTISSGTLAVGNDQAFGVSNVVNLAGGNLGGAVGMWSITNTVNVQNNAGIITEGTLILTGAITNNAALTKTGAGTLLLNGSKTGTGALTVSSGVLGGTGTLAGAVTNQATITAAETNSIGTLTVENLDMASNSTLFWNCNAVTQDVINVTGTLTLPAVATVIVGEETLGDLGSTPRVLITFGSGPGATLLPNWVISGTPQGVFARVNSSNQVIIFRPPGGTMISIF